MLCPKDEKIKSLHCIVTKRLLGTSKLIKLLQTLLKLFWNQSAVKNVHNEAFMQKLKVLHIMFVQWHITSVFIIIYIYFFVLFKILKFE